MIKAYMNEIKRRVRARFQLRGVRHGVGNYIFGGIRIIERKNFECGSYCRFNDGAYINASNGLKIGNDVTLSANCTILTTGLDYNSWAGGERKHLKTGGGVFIGDHVWIGANAIILPGIQITGQYVIVGAGSVVTKDIDQNYCIYVGNPAHFVKNIDIHEKG